MALAEIELDLVWDENKPQYEYEEPLALLRLLIARALRVDVDNIDIVDFEHSDDSHVAVQVVCNDQSSEPPVIYMDIDLRTGDVIQDN